MEPKYLVEDVIIHPNHHLTFGDWILRELNVFSVKTNGFGGGLFHQQIPGFICLLVMGKCRRRAGFSNSYWQLKMIGDVYHH